MSHMEHLTEAVLKQLDEDNREEAIQMAIEAVQHGAVNGFPGFCYYSDTCAFFEQNAKSIMACWNEYADEFSSSKTVFLSNLADVTLAEAEGFLCGIPEEVDEDTDTKIKNTLAWWSLEYVGLMFDH